MIDRDRLLARLDEMDGYLAELRAVFETIAHRLGAFEAFKRGVLDFLRRPWSAGQSSAS
ncbi:MAG TPA: hypothetical protein VGD07_11830 [Methylomirabilota bacterium]